MRQNSFTWGRQTFLTKLRHATVIDCLPTTHFDELLKVLQRTGIDEDSFKQHYQNGNAEKALAEDLEYAHKLGIHSLPAYLIQYRNRSLIMQSFYYGDFSKAITNLLISTE